MALKPLGDALDGILKLGWSHGPLGCCGDCSCSGVPFKTGACPAGGPTRATGRHAGPN
jgi:hypothetical protein